MGYRYSVPAVFRDSLAVINPQIPGEGIWPENGVTQENCGPTCVEVWVSRTAEEFTDEENHCELGRYPEAFPRGQSILMRWVHFCVGCSGTGATNNLVSLALQMPGPAFHYGPLPPVSSSGPLCSFPGSSSPLSALINQRPAQ